MKIKATQRDVESVTNKVADEIRTIATGMRKLLSGPLKQDSLILLIQDACPANIKVGYSRRKPTRNEIETIVSAINALEDKHLKKPKATNEENT